MRAPGVRWMVFFVLLSYAIMFRSAIALLIVTGLIVLVAMMQAEIKRSNPVMSQSTTYWERYRYEAKRNRWLIIYSLAFGYAVVIISPQGNPASIMIWLVITGAGCITTWYLHEEARNLK